MTTYAVIGLGYVGLGLAIALSKKHQVIGYDINKTRIEELKEKIDRNHQILKNDFNNRNLVLTYDVKDLKKATFYIISVPTPAFFYEIPNLNALIKATEQIAKIIKKDDIIVYESSVYPTTTEDICIPILEKHSKLKCGLDFNVGYSPERINPSDEIHTLQNITKIVSAQNAKTLKIIEKTYKSICDKVFPVSSIAVAEAAKILENTQRDVNIALMNEFTKVMHSLNINMHEVIEAAKTKWCFVPFKPGFVGGHCISIDPHYLSFIAKRHGVQPDLIMTARKVNDSMTQFVLQSMLKLLIQNKIALTDLKIGVFGISYKENVVDARNSLSLKLAKELKEFGFKCVIHDPCDYHYTEELKGLKLEKFNNMSNLSLAIVAVGHDFYRDKLQIILDNCKYKMLMDIPNLYIDQHFNHKDLIYWNL